MIRKNNRYMKQWIISFFNNIFNATNKKKSLLHSYILLLNERIKTAVYKSNKTINTLRKLTCKNELSKCKQKIYLLKTRQYLINFSMKIKQYHFSNLL